MRIEFVRTGGFAGMRLAAIIDSQDLSAEDAATLEKLLQEADIFNLPETGPAVARGADRFQYQIKISREEGERTLVLSEAALNEPLRALLDFLTLLARRSASRP